MKVFSWVIIFLSILIPMGDEMYLHDFSIKALFFLICLAMMMVGALGLVIYEEIKHRY